MTAIRMGVGRCCCGGSPGGCEHCADNFDRADSTDISTGSPCGWVEDAGDPAIVSQNLRFSAAGIARCTTSQAGTDPKIHVHIAVEASASTATARILFDYVDTANYKIAEITFGPLGTVRLLDRIASVETVRGTSWTTDIPRNTVIQAQLCYVDGVATISTQYATSSATWVSNVNGVVALATSSVASGTVTFHAFVFQKHDALQTGCGRCSAPCVGCSLGLPALLRLTLSGIRAGGCADCPDFNGDYDMPLAGICFYIRDITNDFAPTICQRTFNCQFGLSLDVGEWPPRRTNVTGYFNASGAGGDPFFMEFSVGFQYESPTGIDDCNQWNGIVLPVRQIILGHQGQILGPLCDFSDAQMALTAL